MAPHTTQAGSPLSRRDPRRAARPEHLHAATAENPARLDRRRTPADGALVVAELLQSLRAPGVLRPPTALLSFDSTLLCIVRPRRAQVCSAVGLPALAADLTQRYAYSAPLGTSPMTVQPPIELSLDGLCWHLGRQIAADTGLLPWVRRLDRYRLVSWPDFGAIGADPTGHRLAGRLVKRDHTLAQLQAQEDAQAVAALLNACALCGLLVGAGAAGTRRATATGFNGWWSSVTQQWLRTWSRGDTGADGDSE